MPVGTIFGVIVFGFANVDSEAFYGESNEVASPGAFGVTIGVDADGWFGSVEIVVGDAGLFADVIVIIDGAVAVSAVFGDGALGTVAVDEFSPGLATVEAFVNFFDTTGVNANDNGVVFDLDEARVSDNRDGGRNSLRVCCKIYNI